jgi:glycosyltransferase involved in cell wall biosynthesis
MAGLQTLPDVEVRRFLYGKYRRHSGTLRRLVRELVNVPLFVAAVLRFRPDAIQIETSFDKKTLLRDSIFVVLAHLLGRRVVLHAHGGLLYGIPRWPALWRRWALWFLGNCDAVVVTSREEAEDLARLLGPSPAFLRIPNPVVLPSAGERRAAAADQDIEAIFASRLIPTKGVLEAIEAMHHVRTPGVRLTVFGDGEQMADARRAAGAPEVRERVALAGNVPFEALLEAYRASDIFVFPSYHDEGFPMAFFYAAACGLAVVTTRVRPVPEYCREPDNCLWVEPRDPVGLAAAIDRLAGDPALRQTQGECNRAMVAQFDPQAVAARFFDLYRRLPALRSADAT